MLQGLRPWIECESPTWNARAVNRMMRLAARDLAVMGALIEPIAGRMGFGDWPCTRRRGASPSRWGSLGHASAGGGSDGNFTGANGIPTLDGLGAEGRDYHTLEERIEVEGLPRRGRLMAGLLASLGT